MSEKASENKEREQEQEQKRQGKFLESLIKEQPVTTGIQKLGKKNLDINVYRHTSAVELLEEQLSQLDEKLAKTEDESEKQKFEDYREKLKNNVDAQESMKIEGTLTPLSYKDINIIKGLVTDLVVDLTKFKVSQDVILSQLIIEERRATIFFTLKQKGNLRKQYFASLEEIGLVDDDTINDIYNLWNKNFVLTDTELKN